MNGENLEQAVANPDVMELVYQILIAFGVPPILAGAGGGMTLMLIGAFGVYKLTSSRFVPLKEFNEVKERVAKLEGINEGEARE